MADTNIEPRGLAPALYAIVLLPGGMAGGFVAVTLSYVLGHHGVSVAAISGLLSLALLPTTWQFFIGPVLDVSLTPKLWYLISAAALIGCFAVFAFTPATAAALPILSVTTFVGGVFGVGLGVSAMAAMALTTPPEKRGPMAGWAQTANLGGAGLGGGLALWIVGHAGGIRVAALSLAALAVLCVLPIFLMRIPPRKLDAAASARVRNLGADVWAVARTRNGVLALIAVTLPAALGAAMGLTPAVAGQWHASSDLVALVKGALSGVVSIPGCIVGGYLCTRFRHRTVYMCAALAYALGEGAMALAPHTPAAFVFFVLLNAVILGVAFGPLTAIIYDCLGPTGAATVGAILSSACNLPLVVMLMLLGHAETLLGVDGMLLTEAGVAVVAIGLYAALSWWWRPSEATAVVTAPA